jgi:hypothetical protein
VDYGNVDTDIVILIGTVTGNRLTTTATSA